MLALWRDLLLKFVVVAVVIPSIQSWQYIQEHSDTTQNPSRHHPDTIQLPQYSVKPKKLFATQSNLFRCFFEVSSLCPGRVAKCHGYGGYIRVRKLEGWGKKSERIDSFAKSSIVLCKFDQLIWNSVFKPGLYDRMFSFCSTEVAFCDKFPF